jgi:hypothetical protein
MVVQHSGVRGFLVVGAALVVAIALALGALVAAGSTDATPPSGRTTAHDGPCTSGVALDRLVVTRRVPVAENGLRFGVPARLVVGAAGRVRHVAALLCSLPVVPTGAVFHCPADFGTTYRFRFGATVPGRPDGGEPLVPVVLDPSGCETVAGLGRVRSAATSGSFFAALGAALGRTHADRASFAGTAPGS